MEGLDREEPNSLDHDAGAQAETDTEYHDNTSPAATAVVPVAPVDTTTAAAANTKPIEKSPSTSLRRRKTKGIRPRVYYVPNIGEVISLAEHNEVVRHLSAHHEAVVADLKGRLQAREANESMKQKERNSAAASNPLKIGGTTNTGGGSMESPIANNRKRPPPPKSEEERHLRLRLGGIRSKEARQNLFEEKWEKNYCELKAFKDRHGHLNVPFNENKPLYRWISTQRTDHLKLREGKSTAMTPYRIEKLKELEFVWSLHTSFEDRFEQLKAYKDKHGHCNVPNINSEDVPPGLGHWVTEQRRKYKGLIRNEPSRNGVVSSTADKIEALERLGFQWQLRKCKP